MAMRTKEEIKAMVERMREAYDVESKALPTIFGCKEGTINNWAHFGRVPHEQLEQCRLSTGSTMDWLMFGDKPSISLSKAAECQMKQTIDRVIEDGIDFKAIVEPTNGSATTVADKLHKELLKLFNSNVSYQQKTG